MAYFWHCPVCDQLETFADDESPECRHKDESTHIVDELFPQPEHLRKVAGKAKAVRYYMPPH